VNGTLSALNQVFIDTVGPILLLPWRFITARWAPVDAIAGGDSFTAWARPPGLFGELYDLVTGSTFEIALSLLALMFVVDWCGNLSPNPQTPGAIDRLFMRSIDVGHVAFSWPIVLGHFVFASVLAAAFLPSEEEIVSGLTGSIGQLAGVGALVGFTLVFSIIVAVVGAYLLLKHAGQFITLLVGAVAYPILVVLSVPDHWVFGRLDEYAENAREGVIVAAWYPVPTAFVLGVGYAIDAIVLSTLTLGGPLGEASGGAIYFPVLWLTALYSPEKVFGEGSVTRKARTGALALGAGGAAGAATGSAAGASSGAAAGSAAGSASGLAAGSGSSAAGALAAGSGSNAAGGLSAGAGSTASRLESGSPGASALADGGTSQSPSAFPGARFGSDASPDSGSRSGSMAGGQSAGSGSRTTIEGGPGSGSGTGTTSMSGSAGTDASTATDAPPEPSGVAHIRDRAGLDTSQRYDPVEQQPSGELRNVAQQAPRSATGLADRGGIEQLDEATDGRLYFRGERDGELYDLSGASGNTDRVFGTGTNANTGGADGGRNASER
jgi:hypothetical protein